MRPPHVRQRVTGDFIFLTWGAGVDRMYIVQGFKAPPPIPQ